MIKDIRLDIVKQRRLIVLEKRFRRVVKKYAKFKFYGVLWEGYDELNRLRGEVGK